jgi:hypothetical protein
MIKYCECGCGEIVKERFLRGHNVGTFRRGTFIGKKFNYLTVIDVGPRNRKNFVTWKCQCICGNIRNVPTGYLTQNSTKSCGCMNFKSEIHGNQTGNPQKVTWNSIINAYKQEAKRNSRN